MTWQPLGKPYLQPTEIENNEQQDDATSSCHSLLLEVLVDATRNAVRARNRAQLATQVLSAARWKTNNEG
jgi:hypothetical protein